MYTCVCVCLYRDGSVVKARELACSDPAAAIWPDRRPEPDLTPEK